MTENNIPAYEQDYTVEERELATQIIGLELAALDKWFKGDTSGYRNLWSEQSFTYFDGVNEHRVEDHATIAKFLQTIDGKLHADSYDFQRPRVQFGLGKDMVLLTFQLYADTNLIDMKYNCIEVFRKEEDGQWRVIHSTWSFIRPMDMEFGKVKEVV